MPTSVWTRIVIALAALFSGGLAIALGAHIDSKLVRAVVQDSSAVILVLLGFDRWLWRWPLLNRLTKRPNLHGNLEDGTANKLQGPTRGGHRVVPRDRPDVLANLCSNALRSIPVRSMSGDLVVEDSQCSLYYLFRSEKHALEARQQPAFSRRRRP